MIGRTALFALALAPAAGAFDLGFPVACELGQTCHIQQYFDHDPGPSAQDFQCQGLSYDGHDGTDIALATRADMARGVAVLAAAPGKVMGIRDGIADFAPPTPGKECGNGVLVEHAQGWQTQYCHLRKGSVAVKAGDQVSPGTVLGLVGQSGMADFPHLHLSVRHNGQPLDPFAPDLETCGKGTDDLWLAPVVYQPGGLLDAGLAPAVPEYDAIKTGLPTENLPVTAPALVIWAYVFGPRPGDALLLSITGPEGEVITERVVFEKAQAQAFRAVGRKLPSAGWPVGSYRGQVRMMRGALEIGQKTVDLLIEP